MTIKELRKEKGLTQGKFAESLGVSQKAISAIECGRLAVSAKLAGKIRKVYGAEPETAEKKTTLTLKTTQDSGAKWTMKTRGPTARALTSGAETRMRRNGKKKEAISK